MTANQNKPSRRAIISAIAATPALGLAVAVPAIASSSNELAARIAKAQRSLEAARRFDKEVGGPIAKRLEEAEEAWRLDCAAIPHVTITATREDGTPIKWTTADRVHYAIAAAIAPGNLGHRPEVIAAANDFMGAIERREAEKLRLKKIHRIEELTADWKRHNQAVSELDDKWVEDEKVVLSHPCATGAEIAEKIAFAIERQEFDQALAESLLADVRRIAEGRA